MADNVLKKTAVKKTATSRKGGGKREEHTSAIGEAICDYVRNYKIGGGDSPSPKIRGVLRATGILISELTHDVKEAHLTHVLADDLFYSSMLLENEAKESLKKFMIKSAKGKSDLEKVASLQKLYRMSDDGTGFLAKVIYTEPRAYNNKKSLVVTAGPSDRSLRTTLEMLNKEIGLDDRGGDFGLISCDYTIQAIDNKDHTNLLEKVNHRKFKENEAHDQWEKAKTELRKKQKGFKEGKTIPDEDDDPVGYKTFRTTLAETCKEQTKKVKIRFVEVEKTRKSFNESQQELETRIATFKDKRTKLNKKTVHSTKEQIDTILIADQLNDSDMSSLDLAGEIKGLGNYDSDSDSSDSDLEIDAAPTTVPKKKQKRQSEGGSTGKPQKKHKTSLIDSRPG